MSGQKNYLSSEQIEHILYKSKYDFAWQIPGIVSFGGDWKDILTISPQGLIYIHGNSDTGWKHIQDRHSYYSTANQFGKGAHGNPSKFLGKSIPINDYVNIADDVFTQGNIDTKEHSDGKMFVKYVGQSSRFVGSNGNKEDFVLILYRNTMIVHSLYPKKDIEKGRPKKLLENLSRDQNLITAKMKMLGTDVIVELPYVNRSSIVRYIILIRIDFKTLMATLHLQVNIPNGTPCFCTQKLANFKVHLTLRDVHSNTIEYTRFLNSLGIADLSIIEKHIQAIEKQCFNQIA